MTDKNKTEIFIVLDRSGSMAMLAEDMEGGVDTFIKEQAEQPGECRVSHAVFDDVYEHVYENFLAKDAPKTKLQPRNSTALYDAVGRTINVLGARLAAQPEDQRAAAVIVMIVTDGKENSSVEFSKAQILSMIKHQTEKYGWKFLYLGSDLSTAEEARSIGMQAALYSANARGTEHLYKSSSKAVAGYRSALRGGAAVADAHIALDVDLTVTPTKGA